MWSKNYDLFTCITIIILKGYFTRLNSNAVIKQPSFHVCTLIFRRYIGRFPAAATATGNKQAHITEISQFMKDAMDVSPVPEAKQLF